LAHESRLSDYAGQGVVVEANGILEGCLVTATVSGGRIASDLANVTLAVSGTVYPVFVAFAAPDNFPRPVNSINYTATYLKVFRSDVNTGFGNPIDTFTMYREGISSLEAPVLASGMLVRILRGGSYTLTSGCFIASDAIKVNNALVKVADDDTGRFAVTTSQTDAVGFVEYYDPSRNYLTVTLKQ
jgi:hypothetical protein